MFTGGPAFFNASTGGSTPPEDIEGTYAVSASSNVYVDDGYIEFNSANGGTGYLHAKLGMVITGGKYYWSFVPGSSNFANGILCGIARNGTALGAGSSTLPDDCYLVSYPDGVAYLDSNSSSAYHSAWATLNEMAIALDMDAGTMTLYVDGVSQGTVVTGLTGSFTPWFACNVTNEIGYATLSPTPTYPIAGYTNIASL